ncbi:MAG: hypothetical protein Q4F57_08925 [Weeksellaceae bacterium]|nr:hypothetical protein [Weeksellaceae bacterium]
MKKVLLLTAIAGMVFTTSCKKETTDRVTTTTENAAQRTGAAIEGDAQSTTAAFDRAFEDAKAAMTDAPQLQDPELQQWVNQLHDQAVKAKASSSVGDQQGVQNAVNEITSLAGALSSHQAKPEYARAEAYYNEVKAELDQL